MITFIQFSPKLLLYIVPPRLIWAKRPRMFSEKTQGSGEKEASCNEGWAKRPFIMLIILGFPNVRDSTSCFHSYTGHKDKGNKAHSRAEQKMFRESCSIYKKATKC